MRTLNVRLAAICLAVVVLFGGGMHLLHAFQVHRTANALKVASERAEEEKDIKEAIRLMQSYVALMPKDREAQLHLGLMYSEAHDARSAFIKLEEVLRTDDGSLSQESLHKSRRTLIDQAMLIGRTLDAETHLKILLAETPNDPELLDLDGQLLVYNSKDEEACKQFYRAIEIAPTQISTYVRLASVLFPRLDREDEAKKVMHDMVYKKVKVKDKDGNPVKDKDGKEIEVEVNAKSPAAHQNYAFYLREHEKFDEALIEANHILDLVPEHSVGLWLAGCCYLSKQQYKTAEDYMARAIKADKSDRSGYLVMADIKVHLGKREEAIAVLRQGLEATRGTAGYAGILYDLTNTYITDGKFPEAQKCIAELKALRIPPQDNLFPAPLTGYLDARLALTKNDWKAAEAILVDIVPKLGDAPSIRKMGYVYLGQCYHQEGNADKELVAYLEAVKIDPYLVPARMGLADIYMSQNNLPLASEQLRMLTSANPSQVDAAISYARILIMIQLREDKEKRNWENVDKLLDQVEQKISLRPNLAVLKAEVLLAKGLPDDADKLLQRCSKSFPTSGQIWLALINLAMNQADKTTDPLVKEQKWTQASGYVDLAEKYLHDGMIVREMRGAVASRRKDPRVSAVLQELGDNLDKMSDQEKTSLWSNLGAMSIQSNDLDLARSFFRRIVEKDPKNIRVRYLLCELNLQAFEKGQTPDLQEVDRLVGEIEAVGGRGPFWLYCKAIRARLQATIDPKTGKNLDKPDPQLLLEARGYLKEALENRNDWSAPAILAGKICELQGEGDQALDYYTRAIYRMGERDNEVIRRTVLLLLPRGRIEEAGQMFDYLEKTNSPMIGQMNEQFVQVEVVRGDIEKAKKDVEGSVQFGDKNYLNHLHQGQMYAFLARRLRAKAESAHREPRTDQESLQMSIRALESVKRAEVLNKQSDEVWLTLVRILVEAGQPDKAEPLIRTMEQSLVGSQAPITMAKCCELLNKTEMAQAYYEKAVKISPNDSHVLRQAGEFYFKINKPELAKPLLTQIVAMQSPETINDVCWARRGLALILKNYGDFAHLSQGLLLIEENLRTNAASVDDKRLRVMFLIADPRKEKIGEAIQAMEELVQTTNAPAADYFALAQLYLKIGNWNSYADRMHSVLGAQNGAVQPAHLIFYIDTLLQKKELDDANTWLLSLEKAAPHLFDTVRLRAEYLFLRGNYDAASNAAMDFVRLDPYPDTQPKDHGEQLLRVAQVMEKFGTQLKADGKQAEAAEFAKNADTLYGSLRSVSNSGDIFFAGYLARQQRFREALEVLEHCWDKVPADNLQIPAEIMIQSRAADAAQYQQLEKILLAAANKANRPVSLLLVLADLHAQQQQFDKSISDYREVFAKSPRNYAAMNNLAVGLARAGRNLDEALKLINDALVISGPLASLYDSRAIIYIARQEPDKALEDLATAIRDEGTPDQYFHQAWAYLLADKKTEAAAAFAEATKRHLNPKNLDPREVPVYDRLKDELQP